MLLLMNGNVHSPLTTHAPTALKTVHCSNKSGPWTCHVTCRETASLVRGPVTLLVERQQAWSVDLSCRETASLFRGPVTLHVERQQACSVDLSRYMSRDYSVCGMLVLSCFRSCRYAQLHGTAKVDSSGRRQSDLDCYRQLILPDFYH